MIGNGLVGLLLFAASLGPGYVYVRVAEQRHPRVQRSALVEAVEMVSFGGAFSVLSALLVLALGDACGAIDASTLGSDANAYLFDHPARVFGSLIVFLALSYLGAFGAAKLVHRESQAVFKPARHVWQEVFWWSRTSTTDETWTLLELRDGRRLAGPLAGFTAELDENREIALTAPIYTSGPDGSMELLDDHFVTLREADVLYVSGRYRTTKPAAKQAATTGSRALERFSLALRRLRVRTVGYLLLADSHTFVCRTWDDLAARLIWAREQGYKTAKARRANGDVDMPLLPSDQAWLVEVATRLALDRT